MENTPKRKSATRANPCAAWPSPFPRQEYLRFGPADNFYLVHGHHGHCIALCDNVGKWHQKILPHNEAAHAVTALEGADDAYLGMNGYRYGYRRTTDRVRALTSMWADLDSYNIPALAGLDAETILEKALALHPEIPYPTLVNSSGRGVYLVWALSKPLPNTQLAEWQETQDKLTALFKPLGADFNAKDATRVLRIVGTTNTKNGAPVTGRQTGPRISFKVMAHAVQDATDRLRPVKPASKTRHASGSRHSSVETTTDTAHTTTDKPQQKPSTATDKQRAQGVVPYRLAQDRLADYRTLARLRGGRLRDYRHRMLFAYAISSAWFRSSVGGIIEECESFAADFFADAHRYTHRRISSVLDRAAQTKDGVSGVWMGYYAPRRYRLSNATIIDMLDITPAEMRGLKTLIDRDERQRRRELRRRAKGMMPRDDYLATAEARRVAVLELRQQGYSTRAIAGKVGVSQTQVMRVITASQPDMFSEIVSSQHS